MVWDTRRAEKWKWEPVISRPCFNRQQGHACLVSRALSHTAYVQGASLLPLREDQSSNVRAAFLFLGGSSNEKLVCCRISAATSGNSSVVPKHVTGSYSADAICVNEVPCLRMSTGNKRRHWVMTPLMPKNRALIQEREIRFPVRAFLSSRVACSWW